MGKGKRNYWKNPRRKYYGKKKYSPKKNTNAKPTEAVKTYVKAEISKNIENKRNQLYRNTYSVNASIGSQFSVASIPVSPYSAYVQIDQGVGQGQRIGNRIKLKRLNFSGTLKPNPYDSATNPQPRPCYVILWFYSYKPNPSADISPNSTFLQLGGNSQLLTNSTMDLMAPVNKDNWMLFGRKIFKVGYSYMAEPVPGANTGQLAAWGNTANNDFNLNCMFNIDCTKWAVKNVIYNDNLSQPASRLLLCIPQAISALAGAYTSTDRPVDMQFVIDCEYEDA